MIEQANKEYFFVYFIKSKKSGQLRSSYFSSGMSMMQMMKKIGFSIEACGMPLVTTRKPLTSSLVFTLDKTKSAQIIYLKCRCYGAFISRIYMVRFQKLNSKTNTNHINYFFQARN